MGLQPFLLIILDGWGYSKENLGNPFEVADLPAYNSFLSRYPSTLLQASGQAVGLSWGDSGNSEVGHLTMGAGRIIRQYSTRIDDSLKNGALAGHEIFKKIKNHANSNNSNIHLVGLLTSGKVHASFKHLLSLIDILSSESANKISLHLFTDGRDSGLKEAPELLKKLGAFIENNPQIRIASLIGRDYAMDRDHNWDSTKSAFNLITQGEGERVKNFIQALEQYYDKNINDPLIPPLFSADAADSTVKVSDAVLFFNFREDSMRQIAQSFIQKDFSFFERKLPKNLFVASMTQYLKDLGGNFLIPPPNIKNGLSETLTKSGKNHLHIAESEKYAHVSYFFNGLNERSYERETDIFIESVKDIQNNPEMKTREITDKILEEMNRDFYNFMVINFANADLLAHTGNFSATVKGLEAVDNSLSRLHEAVTGKNGIMIVTADHGNAESMTYKGSGERESRHNLNPAPFILMGNQFQRNGSAAFGKISGILADIAPTVLELMEIKRPVEMTGNSLLGQLTQN